MVKEDHLVLLGIKRLRTNCCHYNKPVKLLAFYLIWDLKASTCLFWRTFRHDCLYQDGSSLPSTEMFSEGPPVSPAAAKYQPFKNFAPEEKIAGAILASVWRCSVTWAAYPLPWCEALTAQQLLSNSTVNSKTACLTALVKQ